MTSVRFSEEVQEDSHKVAELIAKARQRPNIINAGLYRDGENRCGSRSC
jgi:hypothetical protein